jgi:aminoglycoside phosphotransferase (APT) family kinase protein
VGRGWRRVFWASGIARATLRDSSSVSSVAHYPPNLAAVDRALGHDGEGRGTVVVRQLVGGTHATTWLVAVDGIGREAVLREFIAGDDSVAGEAEVLLELDGLDGLAPRLLAEGVSDPVPWLLLSRLPGAADITSSEPEVVAKELGLALSKVHRVPGDLFARFPKVCQMTGGGLKVLSGPAAPIVRTRWQRLNDEPLVLTHFDFWSGNVVWDAGRLSGIVDWNRGSLGPRGFDVGWCRLDLYLLYNEKTANLFLQAYEAAFGEGLSDSALWDLWTVARSHDAVHTWVPNYLDLGRPDLTAEVLRTRHREWTENSLKREGYLSG